MKADDFKGTSPRADLRAETQNQEPYIKGLLARPPNCFCRALGPCCGSPPLPRGDYSDGTSRIRPLKEGFCLSSAPHPPHSMFSHSHLVSPSSLHLVLMPVSPASHSLISPSLVLCHIVLCFSRPSPPVFRTVFPNSACSVPEGTWVKDHYLQFCLQQQTSWRGVVVVVVVVVPHLQTHGRPGSRCFGK